MHLSGATQKERKENKEFQNFFKLNNLDLIRLPHRIINWGAGGREEKRISQLGEKEQRKALLKLPLHIVSLMANPSFQVSLRQPGDFAVQAALHGPF